NETAMRPQPSQNTAMKPWKLCIAWHWHTPQQNAPNSYPVANSNASLLRACRCSDQRSYWPTNRLRHWTHMLDVPSWICCGKLPRNRTSRWYVPCTSWNWLVPMVVGLLRCAMGTSRSIRTSHNLPIISLKVSIPLTAHIRLCWKERRDDTAGCHNDSSI